MEEEKAFYFDIISRSSHKIGALLTVIKEGISLVFEETTGKINNSQRKSLSISNRAVNRLVQLMSDLIDFENIVTKKINFRKEKINIYDLINYVCNFFQEELEIKNICLENRLSDSLALVYADRDKTLRAIINLIEDILKFTPAGSKIYIIGTENNSIEVSIRSESIIKNLASCNESSGFDETIESLLKKEKLPLNIIIAKALIESQGGKTRLFRDKNSRNEVIFNIPKYISE